jgi:hypothetical protein
LTCHNILAINNPTPKVIKVNLKEAKTFNVANFKIFKRGINTFYTKGYIHRQAGITFKDKSKEPILLGSLKRAIDRKNSFGTICTKTKTFFLIFVIYQNNK